MPAMAEMVFTNSLSVKTDDNNMLLCVSVAPQTLFEPVISSCCNADSTYNVC